ncbi:hypothetical protein HY628_02995 [Candidatus Uhrbacteria bacterium]|nr:hypothetical protein [Candidatus Uhrbacteria bacterium]
MSKKFSLISQTIAALAATASLFLTAAPVRAIATIPWPWVSLSGGDLIKLPDDGNPATVVDTAVYYFGADGLRYVFPNSKTYFTWYSDFRGVKVVHAEQLGSIGIGGNVTYRPGSRMIKIDSDPKVYLIDHWGTKRWLASEAAAIALYGNDWNKKVDDVPDSFFSNYREGAPVNDSTQFSLTTVFNANATIGQDKELTTPVEVTVNQDGTFSPADVSVVINHTVRWTNSTNRYVRVASNPHPTHDQLPGFDSANVAPGLNYVYKFKKSGAWAYHNHADPSLQGTVSVTQ